MRLIWFFLLLSVDKVSSKTVRVLSFDVLLLFSSSAPTLLTYIIETHFTITNSHKGVAIWYSVTSLLMYQAWMFWNSKQHETALVAIINFFYFHCTALPFFQEIKITPDWRELHPVDLSTLRIQNRVLRVLSWGQIYHFRTVAMEEPWCNGSFDVIWWRRLSSN